MERAKKLFLKIQRKDRGKGRNRDKTIRHSKSMPLCSSPASYTTRYSSLDTEIHPSMVIDIARGVHGTGSPDYLDDPLVIERALLESFPSPPSYIPSKVKKLTGEDYLPIHPGYTNPKFAHLLPEDRVPFGLPRPPQRVPSFSRPTKEAYPDLRNAISSAFQSTASDIEDEPMVLATHRPAYKRGYARSFDNLRHCPQPGPVLRGRIVRHTPRETPQAVVRTSVHVDVGNIRPPRPERSLLNQSSIRR